MGTISRSQRYRKIATVLIDQGFGAFLDQVGIKAPWVTALRAKTAPHKQTDVAPEVRVRQTLEHLGPTFAKIGQMLSVRPDLIPGAYAAELARLQDEMPAFGFEQVRDEIEQTFGEPLDELFGSFEQTPTAAASIGQVHMATLRDGTEVAVKVQRPDIREVIEADLDILRTQARRIHGRTDLGQRYDVVGLVDEFARVLHMECDYVQEAENAERLAANFAGDTNVHFPAVYWELTSATVLTMERIEGIGFNRLDELDAHGVDRVEIARRGITCYYEQIFIHGFYHADPHPGNLFAMPDGRVAFTDFGRAGVLTREAKAQVADLLVAIIERDGEMAGDLLLEVSRTGIADVDAVGLKRDVTALIEKYYDMRLHEVDTRELITEIMSLIGKRGLSLDSEFALLLTTLSTIQGLGTAVDPDFHFVDSVRPFAKRIIEEQTHPRSLAKGLTAGVRKTMRAFQGFPDNVNRALRRVADGDLKMTVRPGGFDPLMSRVEAAVDRLAFAIVVSAFVLGFSWLLSPRGIPWWLEMIAGFALVCAAGVGVWFFLSIMLRRWRHRRNDW